MKKTYWKKFNDFIKNKLDSDSSAIKNDDEALQVINEYIDESFDLEDELTEKQFLQHLKRHIEENYYSKSQAARNWNIHRSYLEMIFSGKRPPTKPILATLGYELYKERRYKKVKHEKSGGEHNPPSVE